MLELIPPGLRIDFMGKAKPCIALSVLVILVGLGRLYGAAGSIKASTFVAVPFCNCALANQWISAWCVRS